METQPDLQHMTIPPSDSQLNVLSADPLNAEPPGDLLRESFLTPPQLFYVRTHGSIPAVDPTSYRLRLTGLVERPRDLLLDELRAMAPARTVTATLECAGNRRAELMAVRPIPGEVAWGSGVIGTANWRGVPLAEVLRAVGVRAEARHVSTWNIREAGAAKCSTWNIPPLRFSIVPRETSCASQKLSATFALQSGGFVWRESLPSPIKRAVSEKRQQPLISVPLSPPPSSTPSSSTPIRRETPPVPSVLPKIPPDALFTRPSFSVSPSNGSRSTRKSTASI